MFNLKITKMKNLFSLLCLVVLLGVSANVMGQSTGTAPAPGSTHSYSITPNGTNTYAWKVTLNDMTTDAGAAAVKSSDAGASITITWASTLVPSTDVYYVHVVESDGSCTNEKVMPVKIAASTFYVTIAALLETDCWDSDVVVVPTGTAAAPTVEYDHGDATIVYTVTPTGTSAAHSGYTFTIDLPLGTGFSATSATSTNASISGGVVTVTDNAAVTITYTVSRTNLTDGTDAAGDQADFTAIATISGGLYNGISDNGTTPKSDQTVVSRPNTTTITTN
ncbi:MAG: hypothetical protein K0M40_07865 [Prolixibacteraceae bacterium]|nr:hypothetical protein [Prolixibacteraceae bacterium]